VGVRLGVGEDVEVAVAAAVWAGVSDGLGGGLVVADGGLSATRSPQ